MRRFLIFNFLILSVAFSAMAQESKQECPKIEVTGPAGVVWRGEEMTFTANVAGAGLDIRYDWTVSTGTITKGQGTASIVVVTHEPADVVKATVEISGLREGCEATASESGAVAQLPPYCSLDQWGPRLSPNDVRARIDSLFAELLNNPASKGIFIFDSVPQKKRTIDHPKIKFIVAHARFRKFDIERLIFAFDRQEPAQWEDEYLGGTVLYRILPAGDLPISDTEIFDGSLLKPKKPAPKAHR